LRAGRLGFKDEEGSGAFLTRTRRAKQLDARMTLVVPETAATREAGTLFQDLGQILESLLEFIGAPAGWVCLRDDGGRLTFPVRRGQYSESWLRLQQSGGVWGFAMREGPTLLNDLPPWAALGEPPLAALLSCPLGEGEDYRGYLALVNKPQGFASQDASVLQGMAHHVLRLLQHPPIPPPVRTELPSLWHRILDRSAQGILLVDDLGTLLYANAVWLAWTGFDAEELQGRLPPHPFWVSQHDLARALSIASGAPANTLPFRRRDRSLFWCQLETLTELWEGRSITAAFLQQTALGSAVSETKPSVGPPPDCGDLPFGVAITDRTGHVLWSNPSLARLTNESLAPGELLRAGFAPTAAAILEHLIQEPRNTEPGRMGSLVLQTGARPLSLFWLVVRLGSDTGFLFALTEEAEGFALDVPGRKDQSLSPSPPLPKWLALLIHPGGGIEGWNSAWQKRTGLSPEDVEGSRSELVLDWLFPHQQDREKVADCLHQVTPIGCQIILDLTTPSGSHPLACTFLPLPESVPGGASRQCWLLLAGEPEPFVSAGTPSWEFVRRFTRGLERFLRHHVRTPGGLARLALARTDLPEEVSGWFRDINASCRAIDALLEDLANLSLASTEEIQIVELADIVRQVLEEREPASRQRNYKLKVELTEAATPVRVDPKLLRVVLRQLLTNAEQSLLDAERRIEVRVLVGSDPVRCEIQDNGEGLPTEDWTRHLALFFSTKGAFAHDPAHAALDATGLGLTVSHHLLALMQGHLELRSLPGQGTTAIVTLPRARGEIKDPSR
jgi:PAS domain S-box-containing protein